MIRTYPNDPQTLSDYLALKHLWVKGKGLASTTWTDQKAGVQMNAASFATNADGSVAITTLSAFAGTIAAPVTLRGYVMVAVAETLAQWRLGNQTIATGTPGINFKIGEDTGGGSPTQASAMIDASNYLSSASIANNNLMTSPGNPTVSLLQFDTTATHAMTKAMATPGGAAATTLVVNAAQGTELGNPYATWAPFSNPSFAAGTSFTNLDLFAILDFAVPLTATEINTAALWMATHRGMLYPGWRGRA